MKYDKQPIIAWSQISVNRKFSKFVVVVVFFFEEKVTAKRDWYKNLVPSFQPIQEQD